MDTAERMASSGEGGRDSTLQRWLSGLRASRNSSLAGAACRCCKKDVTQEVQATRYGELVNFPWPLLVDGKSFPNQAWFGRPAQSLLCKGMAAVISSRI